MKIANELFNKLTSLGIEVSISPGEKLLLKGAKKSLSGELKKSVQHYKADLIKLIRTKDSCSQKKCPAGFLAAGVFPKVFSDLDNIFGPTEIAIQSSREDLLTPEYAKIKMSKLGITAEDIRGETEHSLRLDAQELADIRGSKALFDCWANHVAKHSVTEEPV